jgi:hypothetical protein
LSDEQLRQLDADVAARRARAVNTNKRTRPLVVRRGAAPCRSRNLVRARATTQNPAARHRRMHRCADGALCVCCHAACSLRRAAPTTRSPLPRQLHDPSHLQFDTYEDEVALGMSGVDVLLRTLAERAAMPSGPLPQPSAPPTLAELLRWEALKMTPYPQLVALGCAVCALGPAQEEEEDEPQLDDWAAHMQTCADVGVLDALTEQLRAAVADIDACAEPSDGLHYTTAFMRAGADARGNERWTARVEDDSGVAGVRREGYINEYRMAHHQSAS